MATLLCRARVLVEAAILFPQDRLLKCSYANNNQTQQRRSADVILLQPDSDKDHRTQVHRAIASAFHLLETKTVEDAK